MIISSSNKRKIIINPLKRFEVILLPLRKVGLASCDDIPQPTFYVSLSKKRFSLFP